MIEQWLIRGFRRPARRIGILLAIGVLLAKHSAAQEVMIPEPETVQLQTKDGVTLSCTYYAGIDKKHTIPIIIVHDYAGRGSQVHPLASLLQHTQVDGCGFAVIVPDMRGHGESTQLLNGKTLKHDKLKPAHFAAMVEDLDTAKRFLLAKNNEGELNIEQLTVIGVGEMGSAVAWYFTNYDWSFAPLIGVGKQGQDVRAVALIAPKMTFKGLTLRIDNPDVIKNVSALIVRGEKDTDAQKWHDILRPKYGPIPKNDDDRVKNQDLFLVEAGAAVSGTKLIDPAMGLAVNNSIYDFLRLRLVNKKDFLRWQDRSPRSDKKEK